MIGLIRNRSGIYKFRTRIPQIAVKFFKRKEINKTLETKNCKLAEIKATLYYNEFKRIIKVIKLDMLQDTQIEALVNTYIIETLEQDKIDRATKCYGVEGECTDPVEYLNYMLREGKEYLANHNYSFVEDETKQILNSVGIEFDLKNPQHNLLQQRMMRGQIEIFEEALNRCHGNFSKKYDISYIQEVPEPRKEEIKQITYQQAYKEFKVYYDDKLTSPATKSDTYRVLNKLMIMVGATTPISSATLSSLIKIKQQIEQLPNQNYSEFKSLSFEDILKLTNVSDDRKISDNRVKDYIKHIKKFFSFCYDNQIITFNPSVKLVIPVDTNKKERFTDDEIKALCYVYDEIGDNTKYLYYCYTYTGMRREELYNCIIEEDKGIKYFNITEGKNKHSIRKIPLHNKLLELGLDNEKLDLARDIISHEQAGRKFNQSIKTKVVNDTKKTLHSLRHTVSTKLQQNGVGDNVIRDIIGHSPQDTLNKVYATDKTSLEILQKAINVLDF